MQHTNAISIIASTLKGTPTYVWILFIVLVSRGIKSSEKSPVDLSKSLIAPGIFMIWGLYNIATKFNNIAVNLLVFLLVLALGSFLGFNLYKRFQKIFIDKNVIYKSKCLLPVFMVIINFILKYFLNIIIAVKPLLKTQLSFTIIYCGLSGLTVGLFLGGVLYTYFEIKKLSITKEI